MWTNYFKNLSAGSGLTLTGNQLDVVGTTNRITANANSIDIAATYVGQTSITTLGTITTGAWNGTLIGVGFGGTGTATAFTQGSIIFAGASGVYAQDNARFFYDATNHRLGLGTTSPSSALDLGNLSVATSTATQASSEILTFTASEWTGVAEAKYRATIQLVANISANQSAKLSFALGGTEFVTLEETGSTRFKSSVVSREALSTSTTNLASVILNSRNTSSTVNNTSGFAAANANGTPSAIFGGRHGVHSSTVQTGQAFIATVKAGTVTEWMTLTEEGVTITRGGRVEKVTVITSGATYTTLLTDYYVEINKTVGSATGIMLLASPETGRVYVIKDGKGDAATNNITITPAAGNIDNAANYVMNVNNQSITVIYNGTGWKVI